MDEHTSHELAYQKGYEKGYADAMRKAIYNLVSIGQQVEQIKKMLDDMRCKDG